MYQFIIGVFTGVLVAQNFELPDILEEIKKRSEPETVIIKKKIEPKKGKWW